MDQLKIIQKMDGLTITCPKLMMDSAKTPQLAFEEGRPKRQRPSHRGTFNCFANVAVKGLIIRS